MKSRIQLQEIFEKAVPSNVKVYYQPPENLKITYPCVIYSLDGDNVEHSDNRIYYGQKRYTVTVIDSNPDSIIPDCIRYLPYCNFVRTYRSDKLNHSVFTIYF